MISVIKNKINFYPPPFPHGREGRDNNVMTIFVIQSPRLNRRLDFRERLKEYKS